jgi:hypothetical protein
MQSAPPDPQKPRRLRLERQRRRKFAG